jgi:predicted type IV restriction endonuclease
MELKEAREIIRAGIAWADWTEEQKEAMRTALSCLNERIDKQLTVGDIEYKIQERIEKLGEQFGSEHRINELGLLQGWLLCGDDY